MINLIKLVYIQFNKYAIKIAYLIKILLKKSNYLLTSYVRYMSNLFWAWASLESFSLHLRIIISLFIFIQNIDISTLLIYILEYWDNIIDGITMKMEGTDSEANPLNHVYQHLSKSSAIARDITEIPELPKNVPKYPGKIVDSKPNQILEKRGLPSMTVQMPSNTSDPTPLKKLNSLLKDIDDSIKLYDNQAIKFRKHISDINNNRELWYDPESKKLFNEYIKIVDILKCQQKELGNQAIDELKKLDPNTKRNYYK